MILRVSYVFDSVQAAFLAQAGTTWGIGSYAYMYNRKTVDYLDYCALTADDNRIVVKGSLYTHILRITVG